MEISNYIKRFDLLFEIKKKDKLILDALEIDYWESDDEKIRNFLIPKKNFLYRENIQQYFDSIKCIVINFDFLKEDEFYTTKKENETYVLTINLLFNNYYPKKVIARINLFKYIFKKLIETINTEEKLVIAYETFKLKENNPFCLKLFKIYFSLFTNEIGEYNYYVFHFEHTQDKIDLVDYKEIILFNIINNINDDCIFQKQFKSVAYINKSPSPKIIKTKFKPEILPISLHYLNSEPEKAFEFVLNFVKSTIKKIGDSNEINIYPVLISYPGIGSLILKEIYYCFIIENTLNFEKIFLHNNDSETYDKYTSKKITSIDEIFFSKKTEDLIKKKKTGVYHDFLKIYNSFRNFAKTTVFLDPGLFFFEKTENIGKNLPNRIFINFEDELSNNSNTVLITLDNNNDLIIPDIDKVCEVNEAYEIFVQYNKIYKNKFSLFEKLENLICLYIKKIILHSENEIDWFVLFVQYKLNSNLK